MRLADPIIAELRHETATTRRMLERAPDDKLTWKPHEKSMTLGRLIRHLADLPSLGRRIFGGDEFVLDPANLQRPVASSHSEAVEILDRNVEDLLSQLAIQDDRAMLSPWRFKRGDVVVFELPRVAALRTMVISHSIHHRGQLSVFLRLLDVPLPPVYGPSADESM